MVTIADCGSPKIEKPPFKEQNNRRALDYNDRKNKLPPVVIIS